MNPLPHLETASSSPQRRRLLQGAAVAGVLGVGAGLGLGGCASPRLPSRARVLVVGGGFAGATAAKHLRLLSEQRIDVVLVEPQRQFVSCPLSNLVVGGQRDMASITLPYDGLARHHGVQIVHDHVTAIDPQKKTATLARGGSIRWDKLLLAPGIDFMWERTAGLKAAHESGQVLHAWKAGPETLALRRQLQDMRDGGVYAIAIPEAPYRCPPGPYERASLVAAYFKRAKPRSKVIVVDANADVTSKAALFKKAWADLYPGLLEYRPQHALAGVDAATGTLKFELQDDLRADVLNVLPVMRAGAIAVQTGLANANGRWCQVNFQNFESTAAKDVHVLGDAIQIAQAMPKSGHMANSHGKAAAAALVAELSGFAPDPHPMLTNVCMSWVDDDQVIHVASVHEYVAEKRTYLPVPGSGGVSAERSQLEARHAQAWARNIWADSLSAFP